MAVFCGESLNLFFLGQTQSTNNSLAHLGAYDYMYARAVVPAAGYRSDALHSDAEFGDYWSSSLHTDQPNNAYIMLIASSAGVLRSSSGRYYGQSVRPVTE